MAIRRINIDADPLPAFGGYVIGNRLQLLRDQAVEERHVFEPAAVVLGEEIAEHSATSLLIGFHANEEHALVIGRNGGFCEELANVPGLAAMGMLDRLPNLFLPGMVGIDGERHQHFQRHAVLGVDATQRRRDGSQAQALLHDLDRGEEGGGDFLLGHALGPHVEEGAELVERMKRDALRVLGQAVVLGENGRRGIAHDAGHRRGLGQALLLHQQRKGLVAPAAGGHLEHAGLAAIAIEDRADIEALQQRAAAGDVLGQFFDRNAGLHAPGVGLAEDQLVERNVARRREGEFLNGSSHRGSLRDGRREPLSRSLPVTKRSAALFL